MRTNIELRKKLYVRDHKLLRIIQSILFHELALSLDTSFENINEQVNEMIYSNAASSLESNIIQ